VSKFNEEEVDAIIKKLIDSKVHYRTTQIIIELHIARILAFLIILVFCVFVMIVLFLKTKVCKYIFVDILMCNYDLVDMIIEKLVKHYGEVWSFFFHIPLCNVSSNIRNYFT